MYNHISGRLQTVQLWFSKLSNVDDNLKGSLSNQEVLLGGCLTDFFDQFKKYLIPFYDNLTDDVLSVSPIPRD